MLLLVLGTMATTQAQDFNSNRNKPYNNRPQRLHILTGAEFIELQAAIKKAPFKDDKPNTFRLRMKDTYMTVDQLQEFIKQVPFNDEKLEWAILAYPYTADVQHFYKLRESFGFISTQEQFDRFLMSMSNTDRPGRHHRNVLDRDEFASLQISIKKEPFADGKKKLFQLALKDRFITVAQLSDLIRQLTFDDEKLAWALMAYNYTADVQRYYQVRDLFTFDSSKQKLDKFLLEAGE